LLFITFKVFTTEAQRRGSALLATYLKNMAEKGCYKIKVALAGHLGLALPFWGGQNNATD
jgi:hypothetical protein